MRFSLAKGNFQSRLITWRPWFLSSYGNNPSVLKEDLGGHHRAPSLVSRRVCGGGPACLGQSVHGCLWNESFQNYDSKNCIITLSWVAGAALTSEADQTNIYSPSRESCVFPQVPAERMPSRRRRGGTGRPVTLMTELLELKYFHMAKM